MLRRQVHLPGGPPLTGRRSSSVKSSECGLALAIERRHGLHGALNDLFQAVEDPLLRQWSPAAESECES